MDKRMIKSADTQSGFSLIEVLVSILVLMVGILGVAAMQMVSFQTNQSAYARSHAIYIAQDIFDRMRANPAGYRIQRIGIAKQRIDAAPKCQCAFWPDHDICRHILNIAEQFDITPKQIVWVNLPFDVLRNTCIHEDN